jgi:hypothetical protein
VHGACGIETERRSERWVVVGRSLAKVSILSLLFRSKKKKKTRKPQKWRPPSPPSPTLWSARGDTVRERCQCPGVGRGGVSRPGAAGQLGGKAAPRPPRVRALALPLILRPPPPPGLGTAWMGGTRRDLADPVGLPLQLLIRATNVASSPGLAARRGAATRGGGGRCGGGRGPLPAAAPQPRPGRALCGGVRTRATAFYPPVFCRDDSACSQRRCGGSHTAPCARAAGGPNFFLAVCRRIFKTRCLSRSASPAHHPTQTPASRTGRSSTGRRRPPSPLPVRFVCFVLTLRRRGAVAEAFGHGPVGAGSVSGGGRGMDCVTLWRGARARIYTVDRPAMPAIGAADART